MRSTHRPTRILAMLTLGLALTLTACGNDEATPEASTRVSATEHNDADVSFASDMVQHHAQALSMVDLTVDRTLDPEVHQLAEAIRGAQGPEIETMTNWLQDWDQPVPETMRDHANADSGGMDAMGDSDMPGMMSGDDFTQLEDASDADFQTMWLQMMLAHHEGAVEMAQTEQSDGQYQDAVDLAGSVVDTQTAEIDQMKALLGS